MSERLVIIGADVGGMAAVSQVCRLRPDLEIIAVERGGWTSYSACGIPYLVGGEVRDVGRLIARTPEQFRDRFGIDIRLHHEATAIDLDGRTVEVRDLDGATTFELGFDRLLVATGGKPIRPSLPGIDLPFVVGVQTLDDALHLVSLADEVRCRSVAVVGGGYIGIEMAEAFFQRGAEVTLFEQSEQVMPTLDPDMGALVSDALRRHGVDVRCATAVTGFEPGRVFASDASVEADLVVLGIGVAPRTELAEVAGLELGVRQAIKVDRQQRTSAEGVWAAGDCCESTHLVSGEKVHVALGTIANKQGRVAGISIGGGYATFPGVVGTAISKFSDTEVARTGLSEREAAETGFSAVAATIESTTRAGYLPDAPGMTVKLVAEKGTGRVLGAQIVGGEDSAKRIDACAVVVTMALTVDAMVNLDLAYAPPFSSVWDPILVAAREAMKLV